MCYKTKPYLGCYCYNIFALTKKGNYYYYTLIYQLVSLSWL